MKIGASTIKAAEEFNEEFIYWATYIAQAVSYEKDVNTLADYETEKTATLTSAKAILNYLLSPAGACHRDLIELHDFTCGISKRLQQISDALINSPLRMQQPNLFNTQAFRAIDERLSLEWAKLELEFTEENILKKVNGGENKENVPMSCQKDRPSTLNSILKKFLTIWKQPQAAHNSNAIAQPSRRCLSN